MHAEVFSSTQSIGASGSDGFASHTVPVLGSARLVFWEKHTSVDLAAQDKFGFANTSPGDRAVLCIVGDDFVLAALNVISRSLVPRIWKEGQCLELVACGALEQIGGRCAVPTPIAHEVLRVQTRLLHLLRPTLKLIAMVLFDETVPLEPRFIRERGEPISHSTLSNTVSISWQGALKRVAHLEESCVHLEADAVSLLPLLKPLRPFLPTAAHIIPWAIQNLGLVLQPLQ